MRRRTALRGLRCALAAVAAAAVAVSGVTGLAAAEAAPQPLTAAQVIELARQAAAGATGPGASAPVGVGSRSSAPSDPAIHGEGDVDAGVGGRVAADPVEVSFSGSVADDVHVAIDGLASEPMPAAGGLPAGAVEVGPAFEVTARTGTGRRCCRSRRHTTWRTAPRAWMWRPTSCPASR